MGKSKEELIKGMSDAVVEMEEDLVVELANDYIAGGFDPYKAITEGLTDGMNRAGQLYEEDEYYIPELLLCSDAMYAGLDVVKPHLKKSEQDEHRKKVVIGVVSGDTHDIGKNLVKIMLETEGFEVIDLGRDVPLADFVNTAKSEGASLIAMSALMTTVMDGMHEVIKMLEKDNLRDKIKVMIGGGPISQNFADKIGADGYSANAFDAVKLAKRLVF